MVTIRDFHELVGLTVMACQRIEMDIKLMYAGMMKGDFKRNLATVKNKALGPVLAELEELDICSKNPYFSVSDYELLYEIKDIRNYWVHKGYASFIYLPQEEWQRGLELQYAKLLKEYKRLDLLSREAQNIRLDVMRKFGRI